MKKLILSLAALVMTWSGPATSRAEFETIDPVPAATLLLPYFEVDLSSTSGVTTLFSINNASASSAVAHVTLWTDLSIPTFNFDVYLTGYDVQTINLRDVFNGILPLTADDGVDFADTSPPNTGISNQGILSQDINFPGSTGPCGSTGTLYNVPDPTLATKIAHLRAAHTGQASTIFGGRCSGGSSGQLARGYITVDSVTQCNLSFPNDPTYFTGVADSRNILWGDYFYVNSLQNFAQGDALVHVEACGGGSYNAFSGASSACPLMAGDYTFYGRYVAATAVDGREPLPTTFATRYVNGGAFDGGTDLLVWRDSKTVPLGGNGPFVCGGGPSWLPLTSADVVGFDERENPTDLCASGNCISSETQRTPVTDLAPPDNFGWLYLNLNPKVDNSGSALPAGIAQAWVTTVMDANGRFSVGYRATALDNASAASGSGVILLP